MTGPLPTVVWVHGGGFVGGDKSGTRSFLEVLAGRGYTTVGVEYTYAPEAQYPTPLLEVSRALEHLVENADRLMVDPDQIVLAGDSAGAQIAAQLAVAITDDDYAAGAGLPQPIEPGQLRALLLACGPYDPDLVAGATGFEGWFVKTVMWAYTGSKDFASDPRAEYFDVTAWVDDRYPPTYLTTGNGDPLRRHSYELADRLREVGADVDTLFFPEDHEPVLPHEYQMDLTSDAGQLNLDRMVEHLQRWTVGPSDG